MAYAADVLGASLDYETTLTSFARLAVSSLAEWCLVEMVGESGTLERVRALHRDRRNWPAVELLRRVPIDRTRPNLTRAAIETGTTVLFEDLDAEGIRELAQSEIELALVGELGLASCMVIPIGGEGAVLGAALFASAKPRRYVHGEVELATRITARAATALEHARLYREARRAVRVREETLQVVAHDLRSPLNAIHFAASLSPRALLCGRDDDESDMRMAVIGRSARHMKRLVDDLLDVSVLEAGRLSVVRSRLPVAALMAEAISANRPIIEGNRLHFECTDPSDYPVAEVEVDPDRCAQVFSNLLGNAIKFTPVGGTVRLLVGARGSEIIFRVMDSGPGIPAEQLPHLFGRFWRARTGDRGGTGLGLAICKGVVESHGGRIWAESSAGSGATFIVALPIAQPQ